MPEYTVSTPVFEGPLDLLLHLIERAELDITRLALAQVTDQYLEHIRNMAVNLPDEVSSFLLIASRLIQIKSESLLPRPPLRAEGEEDPGEALARQLRLYKRYKEIASTLWEREEAGQRTYVRLAPPPKVEGELDLSGIGLGDIHSAALYIFSQADYRLALNTIVPMPRVTIREKIYAISEHLKNGRKTTFQALFASQPTLLDMVITFLALLELVKRHYIRVEQADLFGEISLEMDSAWDDSELQELEFGE